MKNKSLIILFSLMISLVSSQDFSEDWQSHFSYRNITDVVEGNGKVYAASENVIFTYDLATTEIETITTVEGLSGETISTIYFSEGFNLLLVGYQNGLIEIYSETTSEVTTVVDIIDKPTIPPDRKRINHFNEFNSLVYIASDFGISVYDLSAFEFGDTYFIGPNGSQIPINQTAVFGDYIYSATNSGPDVGNGVRRALVESPNLIDFQEWTAISLGSYVGIEVVDNKLYTVRASGLAFEIDGASFTQVGAFSSTPTNFKESNGFLVVTLSNNVFLYDSSFNLVATFNVSSDFDTEFTSATSTLDQIFIGTQGFGIINATHSLTNDYVDIFPDGPLRNSAFSIQADSGNLWVAYGDYTLSYNPAPTRRYGLSHLQDDQWKNIPYNEISGATSSAFNLNAISINPFNPDQIFISSFQHGILEINNDEPTILYNQNNSGLESLVIPSNPNAVSIRVSGSTFDQSGVLWSMTCRAPRPLKSYDPNSGQWIGYDFSEIIADDLFTELGYSDVVAGNDGTKWIGALRLGVIGYNSETSQIKNIFDLDNANLPDRAVKALALDNNNRLWIGTIKGLRVLFNTSNFFESDNVTTQSIIILEDGIPKELLEGQYISDIKVDGANNKWVATIGAGLFYFTSDGQETIYHFTKDNSPLPSNNVNDVSIDNESGIVYMATDRGLVSFRSGSSKPQETLADAFIYPNPARPEFNIVDEKIKIKDISENVNIKITDIEGNLVAEAQSNINQKFKGYNLEIDGGTALWNGKNLANNVVASGVYLVMLSDLDTLETRILKLMVVR